MTKEEIDQQLDEMTAEAVAKGDDNLRPGLLLLNDRLYGTEIRTETTSAVRGQRYRGLRVRVTRAFDTNILSRGQVAEQGLAIGEYEELTQAPARVVVD